MNVADSRRLASALEQIGYKSSKRPQEADVIVLNTCVVRQSAEDKAIGRLSSLRPLKEKNPDLVINLMGCLIGVRGNRKIQERFPWVDVVSPPSDPTPLINYLNERSGKTTLQLKQEKLNAILDGDLILPVEDQNTLVSAYIPIEAQCLANQGVKEITLLGQIVDRYGMDLPGKPTLAALLRDLHKINDLKRIRFLTSHPNWITDDLLEAVGELPKVCQHIEVPNQSGDDQILQTMRRGYTSAAYRELIQKIRTKIPSVSIATDIIVGFPGETEEQFQNTYRLLKELRMDVAHLARYSPREGTYSARKLADNIPEEEKMRRFRVLESLQETIAGEINTQHMGQSVNVLFEGKSRDRWRGRTKTNKLVFVESQENLRGKECDVTITWTGPWSMIGTLTS